MAGSFDKFSKYEPVDDSFSSQELNRSYWFVTHKVILRNLGIATLLVADVLLIGYALTGFVEYLVVGQPREEALVLELANRLQVSSVKRLESHAATPLDFGGGRVYIFDAGNETYDFAVEVQNVNKDWYVMVTYEFDVAGASSTPTRTAYILPGEKKFLTILGDKREGESVTEASLVITNTMWSRIDQHQIADVERFVIEHASFTVTEPIFEQAGSFVNEEGVMNSGNKITFSVTNNSAYNFWSVPTQIALMRGGSLEGIEETQIKALKTGETRTIDVRNYIKNQLVDEVIVLPSIDVFDPSVYMEQ